MVFQKIPLFSVYEGARNYCIASDGVSKLFLSCYNTHHSFGVYDLIVKNWTFYNTSEYHLNIPLIYAYQTAYCKVRNLMIIMKF